MERRKDNQTREAVEVLRECFSGLNRLYWVNVLVKQGVISKGLAGQLIIEGRL